MRKFEKISFEQFKKDFGDDRMLYDSIELPKRSTKKSAGYDIKSLEDGIIKPGEAMTFKTGLKVCMNDDECLYILSRSSQGYKYNVCLMNSVGLIDSDFYNNPANEGHFSVRLVNFGKDDFEVKKGDKLAQGVFSKFLTVDDEEEIEGERTGGLGSTGK
jgi:dUTP pyrophosphatase